MSTAAGAVEQAPCLDCGRATCPCTGRRGCRHTGKWEFYMVAREVWEGEAAAGAGYLCIGCLERRIGRQLTPDDFTYYPVNRWDSPRHTDRLRSRLLGDEVFAEEVRAVWEAYVAEQRRDALAVANRHRSAVARERSRIAALGMSRGAIALAEMIETVREPALLSGRVLHYLRAVRHWGPIRSSRVAGKVGIRDEKVRLRDLAPNERASLANAIRRAA